MPIKKVLPLILAFVMLFFSACGNSEQVSSSPDGNSATEQTETLKTLQLLYCENDTLNPYKTVNKSNAEIGLLLFEPLFKVNNTFEAEPCLAESIEIKEKTCTVKLKNVKFSDSALLSSDDVIFSYNLGKKSENYSYLFYNVKSVAATDTSTVVFTLKNCDPYFASLLTFPILKKGTDELKNEDNVELPAVGTGRFVQSTENSAQLVPNPYYHGEKTSVSNITLIDAPDLEATEHYVKIGATDIYYTNLSSGSAVSMSGNKKSVNLNNLTFLGINNDYGLLKNDAMRFALSAGIDRSEIIRLAYYGEAKAANGFFHPDWAKTSGYQTILDKPSSKIVIENLEKMGYNTLDKDGVRINKSDSRLSFDLLVCKDSASQTTLANAIKSQLFEYGIKINIKAVSREQYLSSLKDGHFQLYVGEVKLLPNMDISPLVLKGGSAAYGMVDSENRVPTSDNTEEIDNSDYRLIIKGYLEGKNTAYDVATSLLSSMPLVPIAYRNALIFYSDSISDLGQVSAYDIFISMDDLTFN